VGGFAIPAARRPKYLFGQACLADAGPSEAVFSDSNRRRGCRDRHHGSPPGLRRSVLSIPYGPSSSPNRRSQLDQDLGRERIAPRILVRGLAGTCLGLAGSNFSGANYTCYFEAEAHLQQQNGSGPYAEVSIITVTTNPPFSVVGTAYYILFGCENCQTFGVIISLPAQSGSFALTGTVEYAVSDT
jgi:hypothetical protein